MLKKKKHLLNVTFLCPHDHYWVNITNHKTMLDIF